MEAPPAGPEEPWRNCSICRDIPEECAEFWKGNELSSGGLPPAVQKLHIVGDPYFDDSTSHSNSCIKRCPECQTCYRWEMEYTFLVFDSEDDIKLTRLGEAEGRAALERVLAAVERAREHFQDQARVHIDSLRGEDREKILQAGEYFFHHQLCYRENIAFAVPALVNALGRHGDTLRRAPFGERLSWALRDFARKGPAEKQQVRDAIAAVETRPPELEQFLD